MKSKNEESMMAGAKRFSGADGWKRVAVLVAGLVAASGLSGCLVAGYSSRGGAFLWPGGFGLVIFVLLILFLLRRR